MLQGGCGKDAKIAQGITRGRAKTAPAMNSRAKALSSVSSSLSAWILSFMYYPIPLLYSNLYAYCVCYTLLLLPFTPPALYQHLTLSSIHDSPSTRILPRQDTPPRTTLVTPTDSLSTTEESSKISERPTGVLSLSASTGPPGWPTAEWGLVPSPRRKPQGLTRAIVVGTTV